MIKFEVVEDTFAKTKANDLELSILAGVDSFTYMVVDKKRHVQVLKEYALEEEASLPRRERAIQKIVKDDALLRLTYGQTQLGVIGLQATILPERLYNPAKNKTYLEQLTTLSVNAEILVEDLHHLSAKLIYALDPKTQLIGKQFSSARRVHLYTAFLDALRPHAATQKGAHIFCHVRARKIYLFLFDGTLLQYANHFTYQSARDFLYYVLLVFKSYNLDPKDVPLYLSGQLVKDSEVYRLLFRYLQRIDFLKVPSTFSLGPKLSLQPAHFYFDLMSIQQHF